MPFVACQWTPFGPTEKAMALFIVDFSPDFPQTMKSDYMAVTFLSHNCRDGLTSVGTWLFYPTISYVNNVRNDK